jgi:hypothetical protein
VAEERAQAAVRLAVGQIGLRGNQLQARAFAVEAETARVAGEGDYVKVGCSTRSFQVCVQLKLAQMDRISCSAA